MHIHGELLMHICINKSYRVFFFLIKIFAKLLNTIVFVMSEEYVHIASCINKSDEHSE